MLKEIMVEEEYHVWLSFYRYNPTSQTCDVHAFRKTRRSGARSAGHICDKSGQPRQFSGRETFCGDASGVPSPAALRVAE
jgi:hypothetical protein